MDKGFFDSEVLVALLLLLSLLSWAADPASLAVSPMEGSVPTVPTDLNLREGETLVRSVPSGSPIIPSAHVIRLPDGRIVISWKGARTVPYDAIAIKAGTEEEILKFVDGSPRFRVTKGAETYFTVQVIERPDAGVLYLVARDLDMQLFVISEEREIVCLQIVTTIPVERSSQVAYVVQLPPTMQGFAQFVGDPVQGHPQHLVLLPSKKLLLLKVMADGARVDTWLQTYSL